MNIFWHLLILKSVPHIKGYMTPLANTHKLYRSTNISLDSFALKTVRHTKGQMAPITNTLLQMH